MVEGAVKPALGDQLPEPVLIGWKKVRRGVDTLEMEQDN
jgi:hypothetical protein